MPDNNTFEYVHARVHPRSRKHSVDSAFWKLRKKIGELFNILAIIANETGRAN